VKRNVFSRKEGKSSGSNTDLSHKTPLSFTDVPKSQTLIPLKAAPAKCEAECSRVVLTGQPLDLFLNTTERSSKAQHKPYSGSQLDVLQIPTMGKPASGILRGNQVESLCNGLV